MRTCTVPARAVFSQTRLSFSSVCLGFCVSGDVLLLLPAIRTAVRGMALKEHWRWPAIVGGWISSLLPLMRCCRLLHGRFLRCC